MRKKQNLFKVLILVILLSTHYVARAEQTQAATSDVEKIDLFDVITEVPATSKRALQMSFTKESIPWWAGIIGSTLVLYHNDEVILRDVQRSGRDLGIGNTDQTKAIITVGDIDLIRLPSDAGSMMYFLGDGWMHAGIAGGFLLNGYSNNNNRAYNTGLQLVHGMTVSTIFNQILKRSFGRESPYVRTEDKGRWRPFPSVAAYQKHTAEYDAMPSGHVMTATLTFTIINENYPEYSQVVVPLGVTWVTLLSYQMVNNGVHWASDYPLGIAMGYVFGKASAQLGKKNIEEAKDPNKTTWLVMPYQSDEGSGLSWMMQY